MMKDRYYLLFKLHLEEKKVVPYRWPIIGNVKLSDMYSLIDCDTVQVLDGSYYLPEYHAMHKYVFVIDEEGKLKDGKYPTLPLLYHGEPYDYILGDFLLMKVKNDDLIGLTAEECDVAIKDWENYLRAILVFDW